MFKSLKFASVTIATIAIAIDNPHNKDNLETLVHIQRVLKYLATGKSSKPAFS